MSSSPTVSISGPMTHDFLRRRVEYWKGQLEAVPILQIPAERPRPAVVGKGTASGPFALSGELAERLQSIAESEKTTLFVVMLTAIQAVLFVCTGQEDFPVAVEPPVNAGGSAFAELPVKQLVIRADLSGTLTFRMLLRRVRNTLIDAYAHGLPLGTILQNLALGANSDPVQLLRVKLISRISVGKGDNCARSDERQVVVASDNHGSSESDLSFIIDDRIGIVAGRVIYSTDLYDELTVGRLLGRLQSACRAMAADDETPFATVDLLTAAERHQLLFEWNDTQEVYPEDWRVHHLFETRARCFPDLVALTVGGRQVTYRELNRRANRLAHCLRQFGVGAETRVALCLERGPDVVIALLAVMKAGGAYLPTDPSYPAERLAYMIEDSKAEIVLTESKLRSSFPVIWVESVELDTESEMVAQYPDTDLHTDLSGTSLAYIIYTSGSTGVPKGVALSHDGLVNLALAQTRVFGISAHTAVLQFAPFSFDASVSECVTALVSGAKLVLGEPNAVLAGNNIRDVIAVERVEVATIPPSVLATVPRGPLESLKTLVVAGEACPDSVISDWSLGRRMLDAYGPTEITVCATISTELRRNERPSIGRSIANTRAFIANDHAGLAPAGIAGELYVGGVGVARGYWGLPARTAESFVPDSMSGLPGARLHRTGDRVRWRSDGQLDYLGRRDDQVKIRGNRVELGEIESLLSKHRDIGQCAICIREDSPGDRRLVAYVAPKPGKSPPNANDLRRYLRSKLPQYMTPSHFVTLPELPLTPNGKLSRRVLPPPVSEPATLSAELLSLAEETLSGIWREVLRLDRVGARQNFFEIGGDSLLAAQVVYHIRDRLELEVSLSILFENPTVKMLADAIDRERARRNGPKTSPLGISATRVVSSVSLTQEID
jgi:amino acid adenylation domain-containing protein